MVDRNWTKRVTQAAASTARDRMLDTVNRGAILAKGVGGAVGDAAAAVPELITHIEGPRLPLLESWDIGLGQILSGHPGLPENLRGAVGHLDRLGRLRISPDAISFDGDQVRWERVDEIRFGPVLDVITSAALQHEARRLTSLLPPVPGRKWLVQQALGSLVALCLAAAGPVIDDPGTDGEPDDGAAPGIPVSVTYRGLARRKELTPGVFAALVAASTPSISEAIAAIARERGIRVTVAPVPRSRTQALALRRMAGAVSSRIGRRDEPLAIEGAADEWVD
jgi:hypothetical protein